jgi:hypothetical protein
MIYVTLNNGHSLSGHLGDPHLTSVLKSLNPSEVVEVQADGDELYGCCTILNRKVYTRVFRFFGANAQEIVMNWGGDV